MPHTESRESKIIENLVYIFFSYNTQVVYYTIYYVFAMEFRTHYARTRTISS